MTDKFCAYPGNRDEMIVSYLYEDAASPEAMVFEAHVAACEACRLELAGLRDVRGRLSHWTPPAFIREAGVGQQPSVISHHPDDSRPSSVGGHQSWWSDVPVWAQAVAAVLVLGVAAGAANVNVHHDASGFTVRTGWMQPAQPVAPADGHAPWDADLAKLESNMRDEVRASNASAVSAATVAAASAPVVRSVSDDELLRRVKTLIEQSEKGEQKELALRIAQVSRDTHAERLADLSNIQRWLGNIGTMQTRTGYEVASQQQMIQTLAKSVSLNVPGR